MSEKKNKKKRLVDLGMEKLEDDPVVEGSENYLDLLKKAGKEFETEEKKKDIKKLSKKLK